MDHRPFQVLSAGYRIQLREWPQGFTMVRNHETLELPAAGSECSHTASHQGSFFSGWGLKWLYVPVLRKGPTLSTISNTHTHTDSEMYFLHIYKNDTRDFFCLFLALRMLSVIDADVYMGWNLKLFKALTLSPLRTDHPVKPLTIMILNLLWLINILTVYLMVLHSKLLCILSCGWLYFICG